MEISPHACYQFMNFRGARLQGAAWTFVSTSLLASLAPLPEMSSLLRAPRAALPDETIVDGEFLDTDKRPSFNSPPEPRCPRVDCEASMYQARVWGAWRKMEFNRSRSS
jgi:hypothetical protein